MSSDKSSRRRSGVWNDDAMAQEKSRRQRWGQQKHSKEPSMYDEFLKSERQSQSQQSSPRPVSRDGMDEQARPTLPIRQSSTGTQTTRASIRAVTPEQPGSNASTGMEPKIAGTDTTMNFERVFIPHTTTTIVGGAAARNSPASSSSKSRRREAERGQTASPASSRNGSFSVSSTSFLGRSESKSNGQRTHGVMEDNSQSYRPRTRTLDERRRDNSTHADPALLSKSRHRVGGVQSPVSPTSPIHQGGAEYLASVPALTDTPSAPSVSSLGSPVVSPPQTPQGLRSISPISSNATDSVSSALPSSNARRILHLMKTLNGRMSGNVVFRRGHGNPWSQSYCYIQEDSGSLMYESRASEGGHKVLVPELRGSQVRSNLDGEMPYLEVVFSERSEEVHIKLSTQSDFDAWFAALLHWTPSERVPDSEAGTISSAVVEQTQRRASVANPESTVKNRDRAASNRSQKSDRRKSVIATVHKENPVIKIGKMIYWDTNIGYNSASLGQPSAGRPSTYRMQSMGSRRWRRISGQLRENGELKLHSDADNSLISVVQLSQLSRCAIQRLDTSVLENDFCIAIYPQYTASYTNTQPGFIRPIFLSLENRVLYEVWFVLLRAFTMPSIYGPRIDPTESELEAESNRDLESMIATSTTYTFRMERSLSIRVVEAKMLSPNSTDPSGFSGGYSRSQGNGSSEKHGYFAEVLLDNETRGKTVVKHDGLNPLWGESFDFQDLPPVLNNASVIIKRRPPEEHPLKQDSRQNLHEAFGEQGGFTSLAFDVACGKVEIQMEELEPEKEVEKWWPVINMHGQRVGEVLIKIRADEGIILMARDYQKLSDLLHRFSNGLTLQIAQMIPSELKKLSDSLLNIFQVSGKAGDWIMALVEEEIDGTTRETPITRLRYNRRLGSNDRRDGEHGNGNANSDRELIVRDLNKAATLEANLLFRGNTLLTKSLDTHMRRVGKEYLEETLALKMQEINDKDLDCEVDPNRVQSPQDVDRNWRRLLLVTQDVWKAILANKQRCPIELRLVFRHIRACAEDKYGDFLRSVSYSSVSGFLFLRFFCPAVLNPKLFGLLKGW